MSGRESLWDEQSGWQWRLYSDLFDNRRQTGILKGNDVRSAAKVIIPAGDKVDVPVVIGPEHLPPFERVTLGLINSMYLSMKSRLAQQGVDTGDYIAEELTRRMRYEHLDLRGQLDRQYEMLTPLTNWSARPVAIDEGAGLFHFYYWQPSINQDVIKGQSLVEAVNEGKIKIDGEIGQEWWWKHAPATSDRVEDIIGIYVRIDKHRFWLPPSRVPISIPDEARNYRQLIDQLLEPVPETDQGILQICQTPRIRLDQNIDAVLDRRVISKIDPPQARENWSGMHINSLLIDGGSDWPIRVEIYGPTSGDNRLTFVGFSFSETGVEYRGW